MTVTLCQCDLMLRRDCHEARFLSNRSTSTTVTDTSSTANKKPSDAKGVNSREIKASTN